MTELPEDIIELQRLAFRYFVDHTNGKNGLVADNTREDSPCSIAATGLGLSCHPIAVAKLGSSERMRPNAFWPRYAFLTTAHKDLLPLLNGQQVHQGFVGS